jgi:hypothetical protein
MRKSRFLLSLLAALGLVVPAALAQTNFPFQIRVDLPNTSATVPNYSNVTLAAEAVGKPLVASVTLTYTGRTQAVITATPLLLGSSDFSIISPLPEPPIPFSPGDNFRVQVRFGASSSRQANGQLSFIFNEAPALKDQPIITGTIAVNFVGVAPEFVASYALQTDANVVPLGDNGLIQFPPTLVNTTNSATIIILNRGSGPGNVDSVSLSGSAFQLLALPLLPATVASGDTLRFLVRYAPKSRGSDEGKLTVVMGAKTLTASIDASAISPGFSYELLTAEEVTPIAPGRPVTLPETRLGETTSVIVQVKNTGNADGSINGVAITGPGFTLADLPIFPLVLAPGELTTFVVNFTPVQPGRNAARLRVGNDIFELTGSGIGSRLAFSYTTGGTTNSVTSPGLVPFTPATVGQSSTLEFTIRNTGTVAAVIGSIGITSGTAAAASSVFRLVDPPALPLTLQPGEAVSFALRFSPLTTGQSTASLFVDATPFTLAGFGTDPPALPAYRFTGASGTVEPFDQPAFGLTLAAPYPLPLRGTVTLTVESDLPVTDPAVQFATGGRVATFTIAAGSTQAIFQNGSATLRLQTGTVAGSITVTPTFSTEAGLDLTPRNQPTLRLQVPRQAPRLLTVQVLSQTATGFVLSITGYSTTRSLARLELTFSAASGVQFPNPRLTIPIDAEAAVWFKTAASQAFGGQFTITLPFTLRTEGQTQLLAPIEKLESVAVTVSNEVGTSNSLAARIR